MTTKRARARSLFATLATIGLALGLATPAPLGAGAALVTAADGGEVASDDGRLTISFPPGAVAEDVVVSVGVVPDGLEPAAPAGTWQGSVYSLSPPGLATSSPFTATWALDAGDLAPPDGDPPPPPAAAYRPLLVPIGGTAAAAAPLDGSVLVHDDSGATVSVAVSGVDWLGLVNVGHALATPPDGNPPPPPSAAVLHQVFSATMRLESMLDPASQGRLLAPVGAAGLPVTPYAEWPMAAAGGDANLAIGGGEDAAEGVLDFVCRVASPAGVFGATVTVGWDFVSYLPVEQTVAYAAALPCVPPPDLHIDIDARQADLDPDGDGIFSDAVDLSATGEGNFSPLGDGGVLAPPDGNPPPPPTFQPPDGEVPPPPNSVALLAAGASNGIAWSPPAGYCGGTLTGFNRSPQGAETTVEVVSASGSTYFTLEGDYHFLYALSFTGLPGDGPILEIKVRFADAGAAVYSLGLSACP